MAVKNGTLGTVPIEEVVVVARVRSIPERRGRVTLDFNVELPKELLGRSRSVVITPFLHRQDEHHCGVFAQCNFQCFVKRQ